MNDNEKIDVITEKKIKIIVNSTYIIVPINCCSNSTNVCFPILYNLYDIHTPNQFVWDGLDWRTFFSTTTTEQID